MATPLPTPSPREPSCDWPSASLPAYESEACRESLERSPCEGAARECRHCRSVLCADHGPLLAHHFHDCPLVLVAIHRSVAALAERIEDKRRELRHCVEQQAAMSRRIEDTQRLIARLGAAQRIVAASVEVEVRP